MAEENAELEMTNVEADPQLEAPTGEGEIPGTGEPTGDQPSPAAEPDDRDNLQKRFDEMTAEKWALSRETEERNARIEALERQLKEVQTKTTSAAPAGSPQRDSFETDEEYVDALTEYKLDQKIAALRADEEASIVQEEREDAQASLKAKLAEGHGKHSDFSKIAFQTPFVYTPQMLDVMASLDDPAEVAYFLGKNHTLGYEIAAMKNPITIATRLGQIQQMATAAGLPKPEPKAVTGAPEPSVPVAGGGGNAAGHTVESLAKLEQADFNRTVREMRVAKGIV